MKALSLYEPWATLIALGEKRYETRSWSTIYRGPLLICASKRKLPIVQYPCLTNVLNALYRVGISLNGLNWGRAIALVDLTDIYRADDLLHVDRFYRLLPENEKSYGDFSAGRFAWKLQNVRRFVKPPLMKGRQGLFEIPDNLIKDLETYGPI